VLHADLMIAGMIGDFFCDDPSSARASNVSGPSGLPVSRALVKAAI
jgi:hypothetical protein